MNTGGMYEVLKLATATMLKRLENEEFTTKEIMQFSGLSEKAASNNLNRLVRANLLVREEKRRSDQRGRIVTYRLNGDRTDEILENLFDVDITLFEEGTIIPEETLIEE